MAIVPGFEYDIFISYRHNDNRSGWVTEFVKALQEELAATIKEPISVYFDTNPYDGLLETHNVDKSLESKLKSIILIPVLSQTYCDPKSFAWQHEFCVFNRLAKGDQFGRDIKLSNGNVTSRILPIKIHDLDAEDITVLEAETASVIRAIEFIFRSPGVNRSLSSKDTREENSNRTLYRDQVNKVANAVKGIISGIKNPGKPSDHPSKIDDRTKETVDVVQRDKSLAVLPFANLSQDPTQEYFADGITENILMRLSTLPQFHVISRTSVMRYKKTTKSVTEIAEELGVQFLLEGSAQTHKDKVRISVQLINAAQDKSVWSKVFVESMDDIFAIQGNVAEIVAKELQTSLSPQQAEILKEVPTKNLEAYDLFLKGRHAFNQWSVEGYRIATEYFKKAIDKDPEFREAYSYLASSYSARMSWNGDLAPEEAVRNIEIWLREAWRLGPSDNDYLSKAFIEFFVSKDFPASERLLLPAIKMSPNNASLLYMYSYLLNMMGRFAEASEWVDKAKQIDPLTVGYFNYQVICLYLTNQMEEAVITLKEALQLYPAVVRFYDFLGRIYLTQGRNEEAIAAILKGFDISHMRPPSMVAYLAAAYVRTNKPAKAKELLEELEKRSEANEKGVNIYVVHIHNALGDIVTAERWLAKARKTNDVDLIWWDVDPLLKNLHTETTALLKTLDFEAAEKYIVTRLEKEMPRLQYHNIDHIYDVLAAALSIAKTESLTEDETSLLRLAALFHDAGFIRSPKNHEQMGAEMATEALPKFGLSADQIEVVCKMILATKIPQTPATQLEKILCDADLDYLGREDFYEIGGRLLEELKDQGIVETEREWNLVQRTFLESHRFHTNYSMTSREDAKKQRLAEIISKLKSKA